MVTMPSARFLVAVVGQALPPAKVSHVSVWADIRDLCPPPSPLSVQLMASQTQIARKRIYTRSEASIITLSIDTGLHIGNAS